MAESQQHKLDRVRPPRVQITYDVEVGGAIQKKELPFVAGVMANLSGQPDEQLPKLKDRKFVDVDRDNFDKVLEGSKPRVVCRVSNRLENDGSDLSVELKFTSMEDFEPHKVVEQIEPLQKLLDARTRLSELLNRLDGNDRGLDTLDAIISNTEQMRAIRNTVRSNADSAGEDTTK